MPYFSIITPMFNRAESIGRAVTSCLSQSFSDFELLIVDDGSTDDSAAVASSYQDARLKVLRHGHNRGPCPARNTAIAAARGNWFVTLDSDMGLVPGALQNLYERTSAATPRVGNIGSSCRWDTGIVSPSPSIPRGPIEYTEYLQWAAGLTVSEYMCCLRREVFETIRYPDSRAWEAEFHLNLARCWQIHVSRDVLVKVYTDAANRLTLDSTTGAVRRLLADAPDKRASFEAILTVHGPSLREFAPEMYNQMLICAGREAFLCGCRRIGTGRVGEAWSRRPPSLELGGLLLLGWLGRHATARATIEWRRKRNWRS